MWDIPSRILRRHYQQQHAELRCVCYRSAGNNLLLGTEEGPIEVFSLSGFCAHGEDLRLPLPEPQPEPEPEPQPEPEPEPEPEPGPGDRGASSPRGEVELYLGRGTTTAAF